VTAATRSERDVDGPKVRSGNRTAAGSVVTGMRTTRTALVSAVIVATAVTFVVGCSSSSPHGSRPPARTTTSTPVVAEEAAHPPRLLCPTHSPQRVAAHQVAGTSSTFVPGRPTELLACRYHGLNQPQPVGTFARSARVASGPIVVALNGARRVPNGEAFNCPADFAETIVLLFGYSDGSTLTVTASTGGCGFAHNGDLTVWMPGATLARLEAVLGHDEA
jgi:hypothetical protein